MGTDRYLNKAVSGEQAGRMEAIQRQFCMLSDVIDGLIPEGKEKSLYITKMEEACMWATKAISREKKDAEA